MSRGSAGVARECGGLAGVRRSRGTAGVTGRVTVGAQVTPGMRSVLSHVERSAQTHNAACRPRCRGDLRAVSGASALPPPPGRRLPTHSAPGSGWRTLCWGLSAAPLRLRRHRDRVVTTRVAPGRRFWAAHGRGGGKGRGGTPVTTPRFLPEAAGRADVFGPPTARRGDAGYVDKNRIFQPVQAVSIREQRGPYQSMRLPRARLAQAGVTCP